MKTFLTLPVLVVALSIMSVGCTKKRDPKLADGDGRFSETVSTYDGKVFKLATHEALGKGGLISASEDAVQSKEDDQSIVKTFPAVRYTTDAKLVDAVPLLAKPNTPDKYEIHYSVTNTHLVVSKVAPKEYIPYQEKTYAKTLSDGRLSVPLFGYPIVAKINREVAKNDLGEKTSRLVERSVQDIAQASHIQIDFSRFEEFGAIKKVDTFPVNFFTGDNNEYEWYFGETVLSTPNSLARWIGDGSTLTLFDVQQSLVKFQRSQNGLEIIGLAVDEMAQGNKSNFKVAGMIPGEFKEFKVEKEGRFERMREQEESPDQVHWSKSKYIKLDFSRMFASWVGGKNPYLANAASNLKVVSMNLENDYISVILENRANSVRFHVSFLKKKKDDQYKKMTYHEFDNNLFGYYATLLPSGEATDYRMRRTSDKEKAFVINRFDPEVKTITYYVSNSTPDWAIPGAQASIEAWDKAFNEANTGIRVVLGKGKKETGDIRYNIINMIDTKGVGGSSGLMGYGPVLSDPFTGRVISATSTIHLQNFRFSIVADIRSYLLAKTGAIPDYYSNGRNGLQAIFTNAAANMKAALTGTDTKKSEQDQQGVQAPVVKTFDPFDAKIKSNPSRFLDTTKMSNPDFYKKYSSFQREAEVPVLMDNIEQDLTTYCPEVLTYIAGLKANGKKYDENEVPLLEKCADKIIPKALIPTLVHELGHNFGLRHNFAGSSDRKNFHENAQGEPVVNTSSIMDYVPLDYRHLDKPGKYDIAAIRYAYAGEVQLNQEQYAGKFIKIKHDRSILENLKSQGIADSRTSLKAYKFCNEYQARGGNTDPLCADFDIGWTPEQAVDYWMKEANTTFALGQYKWDRAAARDKWVQASAFYQSIHPMMKFYAHWREKLAEYMGKKNLYLEGMTVEAYNKILEGMSKDPQYGPIYKTYFPLSKKIFDFLVNYSFLPDRYCVVEKNNGNMDVVEFNKVRRRTFILTNQSVKSCSDEATKSYYSEDKSRYITEFGYSSQDIRYDLSDDGQVTSIVDQVISSFDVISTDAIKDIAAQMVTLRVISTQKGWEMGLYPAFIDEPQNREFWLQKTFNRVVNGLNPKDLLEQADLAKALKSHNLLEKFSQAKLSPRFNEERTALDSIVAYTKWGMNIPGNIAASEERMKPIAGYRVQSGGVELLEGLYFAPGSEASYTVNLLEKYMGNKSLMKLNVEEFQTIVQIIAAMDLPQTQEAVAKLTIADITAKIQTFQKVATQAAGGNEEAAKVLVGKLASLFPEVALIFSDYQQYMQKAQSEVQSNPELQSITDEAESQKKVQELIKKVMDGSALQLVKKFKPFNLANKVKEVAERIEDMKKNNDETAAQQDLILMFMLR